MSVFCLRRLGAIVALACLPLTGQAEAGGTCAANLDVEVTPLTGGEPVRLCEAYRDQVVLVVNTASKCGFTPQYAGLEQLYADYADRGFAVLGFPSNDFGSQEPGTEAEIKDFCRMTYGVKFPMFEKTRASADNADPVYRKLAEAAGEYPRWNFHKYLLDRNGTLVGSFGSRVTPDSLRSEIEALLSSRGGSS